MAYTQTNSPSTVNTIALAETMTGVLDKALEQKAVTGFLTDGGLKPKFAGNGIVIIPEVNMSAMGDYDRDTGFAKGSVTITNTPYQLSQDRGRSFQLDAQDADESGIGDLAGQVMGEFVRTKVVPEVDAYVLSKIVGAAAAQSGQVEALTTALPVNTIVAKLRAAINAVQDVTGVDEDIVCFIDGQVNEALQTTTELSRMLPLTEFKKGELTTQVHSLNGIPLLPVPSARMKSAYTFNDGTTSGQTAGGFVPASSAKNVGFIVLPKKAVALVKKTEKTRVFSPAQNTDMDAWKMDYRLYYDLFVRNPYKKAIRALTYTPGT